MERPLGAWRALEQTTQSLTVTEELLALAARSFGRERVVYLHHVVACGFEALPTMQAARKALRKGLVLVDGQRAKHDQVAEKGIWAGNLSHAV